MECRKYTPRILIISLLSNMKKILLPTDFSELGNFAYGVANKLAKDTNAEIIALSIVAGPPGAIYSLSGELTNDKGNDYSEWKKKLDASKTQLESWVADKPRISRNITCIGKVDDTILRISEVEDANLIVMGSEGLYQKPQWTKDSHTEYVTNHSDVPVLSLKRDRQNIDLKQIVLVGDFLMAEKINFDVLKAIQAAYQSTVVLLKIITPSEIRNDEEVVADMEAFAKANSLSNYVMKTFNDLSVESGIGKFADENEIDLIAIGTHQGHGFSKLFRGSISDDVVNHLNHPILTFPI